ncbi:dTDP-4-dehydrorhamnose reductase [Azospirillum himalayense]|uniref:dTDP-4-dehydrorhamnose reductase n=1 Tax=Azospirillum himalayense TaxID=654847 RepID=A0ABW0G4P2_9PROT
MVRLLLTGADGQLGWEVARRAAPAGIACRSTGRATLDITDRDAVRRLVREAAPSVVVNAAAYTAVDKAEADADAAYAVNRDGPAHLAEACADAGVPLIHVSTDYVFDGSKPTPYREDDPVAPLGVYGASKLAGEEAVRRLCPRHVILRTAWVYGVHGHNFVKTMLRLGRERDRLRVVDDQRGCPTFAGDLADTLLALAERLDVTAGAMPAEGFGTFHATGQGATSWCGFARRIFELAAPHLAKVPHVEAITTADFPTPARRPANSVLDCGRLARVHGLTLRPWEMALPGMLDSVLSSS